MGLFLIFAAFSSLLSHAMEQIYAEPIRRKPLYQKWKVSLLSVKTASNVGLNFLTVWVVVGHIVIIELVAILRGSLNHVICIVQLFNNRRRRRSGTFWIASSRHWFRGRQWLARIGPRAHNFPAANGSKRVFQAVRFRCYTDFRGFDTGSVIWNWKIC